MKNLTVFILSLLFVAPAFAHSGGTDSSGCHHDRQNGGYHCHRSLNNREIASENSQVFYNTKSHIYHSPSCRSAKACTVNCITLKKSEAVSRGGRACKVCGG